ncbi:MAG TPA: MFS transporter [Gaiellaceae bacterium]|jgi:MFS family permease|nr:MFS transporter [Gaiellaceae bacterium]
MGRPLAAGTQLGLLGREPSFRRLFLATLGSGAGTWLALVALEVDIWTRTESSAWVAALLIADLLPTFAIGILVGPLIDRLSRRRLMIGSDLARFGVFAVLPFTSSALQITALATVAGIATGFFRPAVYAGLPNLVQDADLPSANSLLQAVDNLTWALGSLAGGVLVAASGVDAAYWINACTFLISAVFLWGIPQRLLQATQAASRGHWLDLKDGFALTVRSRALLTVLIAWNVAMFSNAAVNVAEPRLAFRAFDAGQFGLGLMMGCSGIGLAIGAFLASSWIERRGLPNVYGASLGLMALGIGLTSIAPNVWVAAACVVISGAGNGAAVVCNALLVQRGAPDALRGRAFAVLMSSNVAMLMLGMIVAGYYTDIVGPRWIWAAAAVAAALAGVIGFALARAASRRPGLAQAEPRALHATPAEPTQRAV